MTTALVAVVASLFAALGVASERLASVWPAAGASHRRPGARTLLLGAAAALAGSVVAARSQLPWWATAAYLVILGILVVLAATDLEQRRLPHLLLDPLLVLSVAFVPFNPSVEPLLAIIAAVASVAVLGGLGLVVRGGVALGDLYLVAPIGLILGFPAIFTALFAAAFLSAGTSLVLLAARRVGMRSHLAFGPFLVAGAVIALAVHDTALRAVR